MLSFPLIYQTRRLILERRMILVTAKSTPLCMFSEADRELKTAMESKLSVNNGSCCGGWGRHAR